LGKLGELSVNQPLVDLRRPTEIDTEPVGGQAIEPDSTERRLRADAVRNRQRVLAAAAQVFAERGLDVSLDDVADVAGVGVGTVYRRFANKEALLDALFEEKVEGMLDLASEAAAIEDPWEGLVHFIERALEWQACNRGLRQVLLQRELVCAATTRVREALTPIMEEIMDRAKAAGKLRRDVVVNDLPILFTMVGAVSDYVGGSDPDLWRRYTTLVIDGLAASRTSGGHLHDPPSQAAVDAAMGCH